jgi:holo-[acyl-carrier-protein] synthase
MIYGIGTDIVQISRVAAALARSGPRFAEKILGPEELLKYHARSAKNEVRGLRFLATRFLGQGSLLEGDRHGHAHAHDLAQRADAQ